MSDSDDTDVLLMIPPDFFLAESDRNTNNTCTSQTTHSSISQSINSNAFKSMANKKYQAAIELQELNDALATLENGFHSDQSDITPNYACGKQDDYCPSFTSSIYMNMNDNQSKGFQHSTPLNASLISDKGDTPNKVIREPKNHKDSKFLQEIDSFLNENPTNDGKYVRFNEKIVHALATETLKRHNEMLDTHRSKSHQTNESNMNNSLTNAYINTSKCSGRKEKSAANLPKPLLSLCDIWGPEGQTETLTLQEEKLRREHCEKTIHRLQMDLLEYKQKISVAIKIDRSKDEAINRLHATISSLMAKTNQLEETLSGIEDRFKIDKEQAHKENIEQKEKIKILESELYNAIGMSKKLQERNESLEMRIEHFTSSSNELKSIHQKQIDGLEERLSNLTKSEQRFIDEIAKIKGQNVLIHQDYERAVKLTQEYQKQNEDFENELIILRQQKSNAAMKFKEEKSRADLLEKQKLSLQQSVNSLSEKEKNLLKEMNSQCDSLKSYYQKQLEEVVAKKMKEFQLQIDHVEETLKEEAQQKELFIAERAIKQMQTLCEKNDEDILMLNQKHKEEIELYRIQLSNATETIKKLQDKLNAYQSKRADIAERLHGVMETQWQRALEIITSPNVDPNDIRHQSIDGSKLSPNRADGISTIYRNNKAERDSSLETPTTSRSVEVKNSDRLHAYVDFLLKKSPHELDELSKMLNRPVSKDEKENPANKMVLTKHKSNSRKDQKQPWK